MIKLEKGIGTAYGEKEEEKVKLRRSMFITERHLYCGQIWLLLFKFMTHAHKITSLYIDYKWDNIKK